MTRPGPDTPLPGPQAADTGDAWATGGAVANTGIIYGPVTVGANQNRYVIEPWTPATPGRPAASASPSWLLAAR